MGVEKRERKKIIVARKKSWFSLVWSIFQAMPKKKKKKKKEIEERET